LTCNDRISPLNLVAKSRKVFKYALQAERVCLKPSSSVYQFCFSLQGNSHLQRSPNHSRIGCKMSGSETIRMIDPPEIENADTAAKAKFTRSKFLIVVAIVILIIFASLTPVGYRKWHTRRTEQYRAGCSAARDDREWGKLDIISKMWLSWDANNDDARMFRAEALLQSGKLREAADTISRISDIYQGTTKALTIQGEILFGDLDLPYEAEQVWLRMQKLDPPAELPRQRLIYFYSMSLQRKKLIEQLRDGIELASEPPESYTYLMLSSSLNFTDGIEVLQRWRKNYPEDEKLDVAEAFYYAKNKTDGDEGLFEKSDIVPGDLKPMLGCLTKYPDNLEVRAFHLEKRIFDGDIDGVAELLKTIPLDAEKDSRIWRHRSWLLKVRGNTKEAITAIEQSIALDRFDWRAKWEQAALLRITGNREEAEIAARLANEGKLLEKKLMELPNAQMLTWRLVEELRDYFRKIGDDLALKGIERRMPAELLQASPEE